MSCPPSRKTRDGRAGLLGVTAAQIGLALSGCSLGSRSSPPQALPQCERPGSTQPTQQSARPYRELRPATQPYLPSQPQAHPYGSTSGRPREIVVLPGDTVFGIATRYRVSAQTLMSINNLPDGRIFPGQRLALPAW